MHVISLYEFFEKIVENVLDCECSMNIYTGREDDAVYLKIITDAATDLSALASDTVTMQKDEDGEQQLMLRLRTGGVTI